MDSSPEPNTFDDFSSLSLGDKGDISGAYYDSFFPVSLADFWQRIQRQYALIVMNLGHPLPPPYSYLSSSGRNGSHTLILALEMLLVSKHLWQCSLSYANVTDLR